MTAQATKTKLNFLTTEDFALLDSAFRCTELIEAEAIKRVKEIRPLSIMVQDFKPEELEALRKKFQDEATKRKLIVLVCGGQDFINNACALGKKGGDLVPLEPRDEVSPKKHQYPFSPKVFIISGTEVMRFKKPSGEDTIAYLFEDAANALMLSARIELATGLWEFGAERLLLVENDGSINARVMNFFLKYELNPTKKAYIKFYLSAHVVGDLADLIIAYVDSKIATADSNAFCLPNAAAPIMPTRRLVKTKKVHA